MFINNTTAGNRILQLVKLPSLIQFNSIQFNFIHTFIKYLHYV